MLGTARAVRDSWQPELVVREPCEYASAVAADEAGIAEVAVGISLAAIERAVLETVAPIIERRRPWSGRGHQGGALHDEMAALEPLERGAAEHDLVDQSVLRLGRPGADRRVDRGEPGIAWR
jgi:hypothetical protein